MDGHPVTILRIETIPSFRKDLKRLKKKHVDIKRILPAIQAVQHNDVDMLKSMNDHALQGNWEGFRELHIDSDWLLVYRVDDNVMTLVLIRTASHDELFSSRVDLKLIRSYWTAPRQSM